MKAFLGKQKLKEKAIALSNSAKSLMKFFKNQKIPFAWACFSGTDGRIHLQYSSASCCMVTAWFAGDFSCTSYLKFSLHTIFRFTWMGKVTGNCVFSKKVGKLAHLMLAWHVSLLLEQDSSVPATRVSFNVVQVAGLQKSDLVFARGRRGSDNRSDMIFFKKITPPYFGFWFYAQKRY